MGTVVVGAVESGTAGNAAAAAEGTGAGAGAGATWEEVCYRATGEYACRPATTTLAALDAQRHAQRPEGYAVEGWRALETRFGDVGVWRPYRAPDGTSHIQLNEYLTWPRRQVATPAFVALLVDWATDLSFRRAAHRVAEATAGWSVCHESARCGASCSRWRPACWRRSRPGR
jgi:hypothetical protein